MDPGCGLSKVTGLLSTRARIHARRSLTPWAATLYMNHLQERGSVHSHDLQIS